MQEELLAFWPIYIGMRACCRGLVYTLYACYDHIHCSAKSQCVCGPVVIAFLFNPLQDDVILTVHYVGAMMVFGFGNVYMWLQTLITLALNRSTDGQQSSFLMVLVRLALSALATAFFIMSKHQSWEGLYCKSGTFC